MGTRADFYVRENEAMEWLGSIGYDGYPDGIDEEILVSTTEAEFRRRVDSFFGSCDHSTRPEQGWPWPWDDSRTTDYSYVFENGKVMASCFGRALFDPTDEDEEEDGDAPESFRKMEGFFPDMKEIKNVKFSGPASGMMLVSIDQSGKIDVK